MRTFNIALAFLIVAGLAAISPPAISFYYDSGGIKTVPLSVSVAAEERTEIRLATN